MILNLRRVVATAIPLAVLASTSLASDAQQFGRVYHPFAVRTAATGPATLGGGATLPIPGYLGTKTLLTGQSTTGATGSLFGYFATTSGGLNVQYCATGSGKGKGVFEGVSGTVNNPCSNDLAGSTSTVFGFLPSGGTKQNFPTLTGTDAPLLGTDYTTYDNNHASGEPVELPSIFGSVAIYYHFAGVSGRANITTTNLCGIYDGRLTNFSQIFSGAPATTFQAVYRSDGSGTTFNFSNHLATVCAGADAGKYNGNQTSTGATSTTEAFPSLPKSAMGESGNASVVSYIASTANTIGYAEAGYITSPASGTNYATVDSMDPIKNLPEAANSISSSNLLANGVVVTPTNGGPVTTTTITPRTAGTKCLELVTPSSYAKPSTGYSIIAVTYLLFNSTLNGTTVAPAIKNLETIINTPGDFKNPSTTAPITTIDQAEPQTKAGAGTTGYSSLGSTFNATLKNAASTCIVS